MTATTSPLPASLVRAEAQQHDLDARIEQAEQRLIAREEHLRRRTGALGQRLAQAWQPHRLVTPVLVVVGVTTLGWLWRRRPAAAVSAANLAPRPAQPVAAKAGRDSSGGRWLHVLPMVWPLLPPTWRERVPPSVHKLALGLGFPLLEVLLERRRQDRSAAPAP